MIDLEVYLSFKFKTLNLRLGDKIVKFSEKYKELIQCDDVYKELIV
jgi:hypothetical protein